MAVELLRPRLVPRILRSDTSRLTLILLPWRNSMLDCFQFQLLSFALASLQPLKIAFGEGKKKITFTWNAPRHTVEGKTAVCVGARSQTAVT
jgi:hypothetical protein